MRSLLLLCMIGGMHWAYAEPTHLTIELKNGSACSFLLDDYPEITLTDNALVVNGAAETSYEIANFKFYHFTESKQTGAEKVTSDNFKIIPLADKKIAVEGVSGNVVRLMDIAGRIVSTNRVGETGRAEVEMSAQKGVFILTDGTHSVKVICK